MALHESLLCSPHACVGLAFAVPSGRGWGEAQEARKYSENSLDLTQSKTPTVVYDYVFLFSFGIAHLYEYINK